MTTTGHVSLKAIQTSCTKKTLWLLHKPHYFKHKGCTTCTPCFYLMKWTPITNEQTKWYGVDFDLTICSNNGHPNYEPGEPLPGAVESLNNLSKIGKIIIFTARPWSDYHNIEKYCEHYNIPVRRIICGKPLFVCMIDDKNIEFNGDWKEVEYKVWKRSL